MENKAISKIIMILLFYTLNGQCAAIFSEKSKTLGITFKHEDGSTGLYHMTETAGGGIGWMDYNNDGLLDLFIIGGVNGKNKLYKNTNNHFEDVSQAMNVENSDGNSMGICSADVNQDGWIDFLVTSFGSDWLYINQQGQSFKQSKLDTGDNKYQWSSSCAFADLDNDGDIDLYVARYGVFELDGNKSCIIGKGVGENKGYCNPKHYVGVPDGMYLNNSKGKFSKINNKERGLGTGTDDRGFGVVISDLDNDNDMDIYVANDTTNNRLYRNNGKGFFTDISLISGVSINFNGVAESSMGIAIGDLDHNGYQDLILSHFSMETNTVYLNYKNNNFADMTQSKGLNRTSFMSLGWGMSLVDIDNDGYDDLIVANGHINDFIAEVDSRQTYNQANQIFLYDYKKKKLNLIDFEQSFSSPSTNKSSRGLATADWNNDGKIDFAVSNTNDHVDVFENRNNNSNNWIGIKLIGNKINRSAIGAVVTVKSENLIQRKEVISGGSFMSQSDPRLIFGLDENDSPASVSIVWPDGKKTHLKVEKLNQYHSINY